MKESLRVHQIRSLSLVEFRQSLKGRRALGLALFFLLPVAIGLLRCLLLPEGARLDSGRTSHELAQIFALFHLRFIIFFGCAFLFVRSFRGEILQHTLHLKLLLPIRRRDLVIGKFFGTLAAALTVLLPSTIALIVCYHLANGVGKTLEIMNSGQGIGHLLSYLGVSILASLGYGAIFLLAGLFFKNPMVPAFLYLAFETLAPYLPLPLRIFSLAHQLLALLPVPVTLGPFAITHSTLPWWSAIIVIPCVAAIALRLAGWRAERYDVDYS